MRITEASQIEEGCFYTIKWVHPTTGCNFWFCAGGKTFNQSKAYKYPAKSRKLRTHLKWVGTNHFVERVGPDINYDLLWE